MAKTRPRDEKFRLLLVRVPLDRNADLEAAAREIGLKPTQFIMMQTLQALNARHGQSTLAGQAQATTGI